MYNFEKQPAVVYAKGGGNRRGLSFIGKPANMNERKKVAQALPTSFKKPLAVNYIANAVYLYCRLDICKMLTWTYV